jgi:hypothetical protein
MSALPILPPSPEEHTHAIKLTAVYCTVCQQATCKKYKQNTTYSSIAPYPPPEVVTAVIGRACVTKTVPSFISHNYYYY